MPPSRVLLAAGTFALLLSTIFAISWPVTYHDGILTEGLGQRPPHALAIWVWIYCLICWVLQDCAKVAASRVLDRVPGFRSGPKAFNATMQSPTDTLMKRIGASGGTTRRTPMSRKLSNRKALLDHEIECV